MQDKVPQQQSKEPVMRVLDLEVGETGKVAFSDGSSAEIKLLDLETLARDSVLQATRLVRVKLLVDGQELELLSGPYQLPQSIGGLQIDCPLSSEVLKDATCNRWALVKDARLRIWPEKLGLFRNGSFAYPIDQTWFAGETQVGLEPVYVAGESHYNRRNNIYYHAGVDFSGVEGITRVLAATDGVVASAGDKVSSALHEELMPRSDVVYIVDARGWYYRYSHLHSIAPEIKPGITVNRGDFIGNVGKEGSSGGWSHLHFDIRMPMPSGKLGVMCPYIFLWYAYHEEFSPKVLAVARPHQVARTGEVVRLDASRSWAESGIKSLEWILSDGRRKKGSNVEIIYDKPGTYSETLKVTNLQGEVDYDFAVVQVFSTARDAALPPKLHVIHDPSRNIKVGQPITFTVRGFRFNGEDEETWNFGDGSPVHTTSSRDYNWSRSDNSVVHAKDGYAKLTYQYGKPGHYIVTVTRTNSHGFRAEAKIHIEVD